MPDDPAPQNINVRLSFADGVLNHAQTISPPPAKHTLRFSDRIRQWVNTPFSTYKPAQKRGGIQGQIRSWLTDRLNDNARQLKILLVVVCILVPLIFALYSLYRVYDLVAQWGDLQPTERNHANTGVLTYTITGPNRVAAFEPAAVQVTLQYSVALTSTSVLSNVVLLARNDGALHIVPDTEQGWLVPFGNLQPQASATRVITLALNDSRWSLFQPITQTAELVFAVRADGLDWAELAPISISAYPVPGPSRYVGAALSFLGALVIALRGKFFKLLGLTSEDK